jgi:hypothetical protein
MLYLKGGELVNATIDNEKSRRALSLAEALGKIPAEPEWGEICFSAAPVEQLACMYTAHAQPQVSAEAGDSGAQTDVLGAMHESRFCGFVEMVLEGHVSYLIIENGSVARGFLSGSTHKPLAERAARALSDSRAAGQLIRQYAVTPELPEQALPPLIQAYREMMDALVEQLVLQGRSSASAIAEHARGNLLARHPALAGFEREPSRRFDPVCTTAELSHNIAAWATETVWAGLDIESASPEELIRRITCQRRHMFQSAGFFEHIPWKLEW